MVCFSLFPSLPGNVRVGKFKLLHCGTENLIFGHSVNFLNDNSMKVQIFLYNVHRWQRFLIFSEDFKNEIAVSGKRSSNRKYYQRDVFQIFRFPSDQEIFSQSFHQNERSILTTHFEQSWTTSPVMHEGESNMCRRRNTKVIGSIHTQSG